MQILLYITIIILFLLVALILLPLRIRIAYHRQARNDDKITLEMSLWKFPKYQLNTTMADFQYNWHNSGIKFKSKNKNSGYIIRWLVTTLASFPRKGDNLKDADFKLKIPYNISELKKKVTKFLKDWHRYWPWFENLLNRTQCHKLHWRTQIGFEDAAVTGWVTGILWMIKPLLVGKLSSIVIFTTHPTIKVEPQFNKKQFAIDFDCIFEVRLGHIMVTGIKLALRK